MISGSFARPKVEKFAFSDGVASRDGRDGVNDAPCAGSGNSGVRDHQSAMSRWQHADVSFMSG